MWTDEKIDAANQYDYARELVDRGCDLHSAAALTAELFGASYTDIYEDIEPYQGDTKMITFPIPAIEPCRPGAPGAQEDNGCLTAAEALWNLQRGFPVYFHRTEDAAGLGNWANTDVPCWRGQLQGEQVDWLPVNNCGELLVDPLAPC